ncbi:MAG: hypothetical protein Q4C47_06910, partial [Planctomycetia bacterium]|nr:hypothetical protein [Planctomycetia bacterium]
MIFWKITLRELLSRPGRALFTLAGIIVAVTAVVAVRITAVTMEQSYERMYESLTGLTDLEILVDGGGMFPQSVLDRLVPPETGVAESGVKPLRGVNGGNAAGDVISG